MIPDSGPRRNDGDGESVNHESHEIQEYEEIHRETKRKKESHGSACSFKNGGSDPGSGYARDNQHPDTNLSFGDYVWKAFEQFLVDRDFYDGWQSPLFGFVRLIKAYPGGIAASASAAFLATDSQVQRWPKREDGAKGWEAYFDLDREDAQAEFLGSWDKVRFVPGGEILRHAHAKAKQCPVDFQGQLPPSRSDRYPVFLSVAYWLQTLVGRHGTILLPVKSLGSELGVQPMTVTRYRKWAEDDGFLKKVKDYSFRSEGPRKADEFVFDLDRIKG